ncbi:MAG: hypothetical protein PWP04_1219 [Candidatus Atribacteria bacterium]|nr:hypothetical protein [Candidatus Atribacteria bacterium]
MEQQPRKRRKKSRRATLQAILYVLTGMALFFAVVYGAELIMRGRTEPTPPQDSSPIVPTTEIPIPSPLPGAEPNKVKVTLFFTDLEFSGLVGEDREIVQDERFLSHIAEELLKGPADPSLYNPIPAGTRLNSVFLENGFLYIDLSEEMAENQSGGTTQEVLSVFSLVNTFTSLDQVKRVKILIEGEERTTLCGHIDISEPLERNEQLFAKIR